MHDATRAQRGFSLLEMLISLALFLVVLSTTMAVMVPSRRLYASSERTADIQQNARLAMAEMQRQIRMAGYFPENFDDPPPTPRLENPIAKATESSLAIHGDGDNSGTSQVHNYCLDGTTLRRRSGPVDRLPPYLCRTGDVLAQNVASLRFTYYDASGQTIPTSASGSFSLDDQTGKPEFDVTAERGAVRRVVVTLVTQARMPDQTTREFTLNSDVLMRNIR